MPSSITHYLFAKSVLNSDITNESIFFLGAQGPDVFFFYGYHPLYKENKKLISSFGTKLHDINIAAAYDFMHEYALNHEEHTEMIFSYIKGLFAHYTLDRATHPYIFYVTLFDNFEEQSKQYAFAHAYFETYVDNLFRKKCDYVGNTFDMIKSKKSDLLILSEMYYELGKEMFPEFKLKKNSFYLAYKSMAFALKVLYSKKGYKKSFFETFMRKSLVNAMSHPKLVPDTILGLDILNESKKTWKNPVSGEKHNSTFAEMYKNGQDDFAKAITLLGTDNFHDLLRVFVINTDHRGAPIDGIMKFHRNIFKNTVL